MATIIRSTEAAHATRGEVFNLDDLAARAQAYLAQVRAEGAEIVAQAHREAADVRRQAAEQGHAEGLRQVEALVERQLADVLPALRQAIADIQDAKQAWLAQWETGVVRLAAAIAARLIRREVARQPEITLDLVREALELAAGSPQVVVRLHPHDHKALGSQVRKLIAEMATLGDVDVKADAAVEAGGCCVDTRFGAIDQQFTAQLQRIEEELLQ